MNEDMSNLINRFSNMLKDNKIPPELSNVIKNTMESNSANDVSSEESSNCNNNNNSTDNDNSNLNFDINTMLKMKSIIDAISTQKDDPRANLLKSLKPYLKESRKEKVDQYIKIFSMEKVFEQFNPLGGDKKHDV